MINVSYKRPLHHYETDADGVCHFSNYLKIFEEGFEHALTQIDFASNALEHSFAVIDLHATYSYPLRAGDVFNVEICFPSVKRSSIEAYAVIRIGEAQSAVLRVRLAAVDRTTNCSVSVDRLLREKLKELNLEHS